MVPASGCSVQRVGTDIGSLLKDLPRHFPNLLIQVFWSVLVQLRQAEEILKISFHTEHVGQQNLENQGQKGWQLRTLKLTRLPSEQERKAFSEVLLLWYNQRFCTFKDKLFGYELAP